MSDLEVGYDVVVVGAGNAGLASALSAAEHGAKVALLEKASEPMRGGNTYFTRGFRFSWESLEDDIMPLVPNITESEIKQLRERAEPYTKSQFYDDVMLVTEGKSDPTLLEMLVNESLPTVKWLREMGHEWTPDVRPDPSHAVLLNGGGASLSDRGFAIAAKRGVDIRYENIAMELLRDSRGRGEWRPRAYTARLYQASGESGDLGERRLRGQSRDARDVSRPRLRDGADTGRAV